MKEKKNYSKSWYCSIRPKICEINFQEDEDEMQDEEDRQKLLMDARVFSLVLFMTKSWFLDTRYTGCLVSIFAVADALFSQFKEFDMTSYDAKFLGELAFRITKKNWTICYVSILYFPWWNIVRLHLFRSEWLDKICRTMKPLAELLENPDIAFLRFCHHLQVPIKPSAELSSADVVRIVASTRENYFAGFVIVSCKFVNAATC